MITVIGSLNMDIVINTSYIPSMGQTVLGEEMEYVCGGKGGNQAFACARLGSDVTMIGCVGEDSFGDTLVNNLKDNGVNTNFIGKNGDSSGVAIITVSCGDNAIIVVPGSNNLVTKEFLTEDMLNEIAKSKMILLQLEIPVSTVEFIIDFAKKKKIPVMLNPAPAVSISKKALASTTYFIVNETECEYYTGIKILSSDSLLAALDMLKSIGIKFPIITLGSRGIAYLERGKLVHVNGRKVKAVDTTAAGDTFAGALASRLVQGDDLNDACVFANFASSIVVQRRGAQSSIPTLAEVEEVMKNR